MRRCKQNQAFTIVELLIVITILSAMIAILMPAISRAKLHAIKIVCASNYRQLSVASVGFSCDTRDAVPWLNTGSLGMLGYGGPYSATTSTVASDELCRFSASYLNSPWKVINASKVIIPKVMIDPGLPMDAPRQYMGTTAQYRPAIGTVGFYGDGLDGGTVLGFGSFGGLYMNGTSGGGSNGGMNGRWSKRSSTSVSYHGAPGDGVQRLRYSDIRYPDGDIQFLDLTAANSTSAASSTLWCNPHPGINGMAEGSNQGYFDASVRWADIKLMKYTYQPASPWYFTVGNQPIYWPMALDLKGGRLCFNWGGYPTSTLGSWANTAVNWYGITTPNAGTGFVP